jgi:hypothetical protein
VSEIRSYRSVFDVERRIYRVDRLRLNPGGVPVRGVVYWLAILAVALVAARVPFVGQAAGIFPWYIRELALPALGGALLSVVRVEGRPFHLAAVALVRHAAGPRHLCGLRACPALGRRWAPGELLVLPDGSGARLRRMRYTGPGVVCQPATGRRLVLARGERLEVGAHRGPQRPRGRLAREHPRRSARRPRN